jgi:hypothetical protein
MSLQMTVLPFGEYTYLSFIWVGCHTAYTLVLPVDSYHQDLTFVEIGPLGTPVVHNIMDTGLQTSTSHECVFTQRYGEMQGAVLHGIYPFIPCE